MFQFLPSALVLSQRNHSAQIGFGEAVELLLKAGAATPQVFLSRLQFLREPVPTAGSFHGPNDQLGVGEQSADVLPDESIQLLCGDEAGWTFLIPPILYGLGLARTDIVAVLAIRRCATETGQLANSTADQGAQQILMGRVVTSGKGLVARQLGLHQVELLL